jgi:hypothetical protein
VRYLSKLKKDDRSMSGRLPISHFNSFTVDGYGPPQSDVLIEPHLQY